MNLKRLPAPEWDFRGLEPGECDFALRYEVAREQPEVATALALLTPERRKEIAALTLDTWETWSPDWLKGRQFWKLQPIFWLCWCCRDFPTPWMALSVSARETASKLNGTRLKPYRFLTSEELRRIYSMEETVARLQGSGSLLPTMPTPALHIGRYIIEIDWSRGDDAVLKQIYDELLALRPKGVRPTKKHTGKRAAVPWHKFKQLAAWRLAAKAGLRYKDAWRLVHQRKKESPMDDPYTLLPSYASPGAWKDAVDAGRRLAQRAR